MAAYRFLGNEEVEWVDMMQPHWERTATRMQQHAVVLCIADTTELDFNGQDMEGLGVPPDVWVRNSLNEEAKGSDRELRVAIQEALKAVRAAQPPRPATDQTR